MRYVLTTLPLIAVLALLTIMEIQFKMNCTGYLEQAANASTIGIATDRLEIALNYIERNNMTSGYTSIIYETPDEDVGFWYYNIKTAYEELKSMSPLTTKLEKSNVLMKLNETLTYSNGSIIYPESIHLFPYNRLFALVITFCIIIYILGLVLL